MALKIADAHTHIYPEKIAQKATDAIGEFYDIPMYGNGMSNMLIENGEKIGVTKYLVCSVATTENQVESINNFLYKESQAHPEFVPFAAMHKDYKDFENELKRVKTLGFKGIKFHPDFQEMYIDDEQAFPIYEKCAQMGLVILFHMGDNRYDYSTPDRLCKVLRKIPNLKCIAAHFGGYQNWEGGRKEYSKLFNEGYGKYLYFDTSSSLFKLQPSVASEMIKQYGIDRFMFGTDFPMWSAKDELERFNKLDLTDSQREKILYGNFEKLFL